MLANLDQISSILALEQEILKYPQVEMPVTNEFCDHLLARTMQIPAETVLTGAIHKNECFFVLRKGTLIVTTDNGSVILNAGDMILTKAMTKRGGIAVTDCLVTTFHYNPKNLTEEKEIFDEFSVNPNSLELLQ